jgi:hypothetical protein
LTVYVRLYIVLPFVWNTAVSAVVGELARLALDRIDVQRTSTLALRTVFLRRERDGCLGIKRSWRGRIMVESKQSRSLDLIMKQHRPDANYRLRSLREIIVLGLTTAPRDATNVVA